MLACADGHSNTAVAARLRVSRTTVRKWRDRFLAKRLDGLGDEPRPGVPRTISDAQVEEVVVRTLEEVPEGATRLGVGVRPDNFVVGGLGIAARGRRFDQDLGIYHDVWKGEPVGGGPNPAVTPEAREIPVVFGGAVPAAFECVARWGTGYVGASVPAPMVAPAFEAARAAWTNASRRGSPYLVAVAYFALGDTEQGQANVWDYYSISGDEIARLITNGVAAGPARVKDTVAAFADIGADELILNPTVGDLEEITRLADIVL